MTRVSLWVAALAVAVASFATAQIPSNTVIAVSSFVPTNGVYYFDRTNGVSTTVGTVVLPFTSWSGATDSIEDSPDNQSLVVTDSSGVFVINKASGVITPTPLNTPAAGFADWGCHGDSGDFYTFHGSNGQVWRHDANYQNGALFSSPGGLVNAGCWDGTTGGVAALEFGGNALHFIDRNGTVTRSAGAGTISSGSGCDWNPFDGSIMVSSFGNNGNIFRVDRSGTVTTVGPIGNAVLATNNSIEVRENGAEEYLCSEFGAAPTHVTATDALGNVTVLNTSAGSVYGPSDACYVNARNIWPTGPWFSGQTGRFHISFPSQAGQSYQMVASLTQQPTTPLGSVGNLHLNIGDPLVGLSIAGLGIFNGFVGTLDNTGSPTSPVFVTIPPGLGGLGIRVFFAGATYNATGLTNVSNCCGATIQ